MTSIKAIALGKCPWRAPTKNNRADANIAPFKDPNVEQATKIGIQNDINPNVLLANVTATACDAKISSLGNTTKYAMLVIV